MSSSFRQCRNKTKCWTLKYFGNDEHFSIVSVFICWFVRSSNCCLKCNKMKFVAFDLISYSFLFNIEKKATDWEFGPITDQYDKRFKLLNWYSWLKVPSLFRICFFTQKQLRILWKPIPMQFRCTNFSEWFLKRCG